SAKSQKQQPTWPKITSEEGPVFVSVPAVNERLLLRLITRVCPVGTVMITGDQPAGVVVVAAGASGFKLAHVAVEPVTAVPQLYPHIGTTEPSGKVTVVGPAVKLTCCWATTRPAPSRRTAVRSTAVFRQIFRSLNRIAL